MEFQRSSNLHKQAEELFHFYDRQRIGLITKKALLSYFGSKIKVSSDIDRLITEQWLSKVLISSGFTLPEYINCQQFVEIISVLQNAMVQDDFYQFQG